MYCKKAAAPTTTTSRLYCCRCYEWNNTLRPATTTVFAPQHASTAVAGVLTTATNANAAGGGQYKFNRGVDICSIEALFDQCISILSRYSGQVVLLWTGWFKCGLATCIIRFHPSGAISRKCGTVLLYIVFSFAGSRCIIGSSGGRWSSDWYHGHVGSSTIHTLHQELQLGSRCSMEYQVTHTSTTSSCWMTRCLPALWMVPNFLIPMWIQYWSTQFGWRMIMALSLPWCKKIPFSIKALLELKQWPIRIPMWTKLWCKLSIVDLSSAILLPISPVVVAQSDYRTRSISMTVLDSMPRRRMVSLRMLRGYYYCAKNSANHWYRYECSGHGKLNSDGSLRV